MEGREGNLEEADKQKRVFREEQGHFSDVDLCNIGDEQKMKKCFSFSERNDKHVHSEWWSDAEQFVSY